ncbi:hypothetical protein ElyMa_001929600 [Elysia marginata]|uniref:Uncharacterized protein n=1 Tax=Elysia marginata TaxID=1093978 RepID=A0AAV4EUJ3_9GAST|nr:hypothetical protein ElyMa_001929600 [Elysia marginata]
MRAPYPHIERRTLQRDKRSADQNAEKKKKVKELSGKLRDCENKLQDDQAALIPIYGPSDELAMEPRLRALREAKKFCGREQLLHIHYFSFSYIQMSEWIREFPNTCFGYTGWSLSSEQVSGLRSLWLTKPNRLLLGTEWCGPWVQPAFLSGGSGHLHRMRPEGQASTTPPWNIKKWGEILIQQRSLGKKNSRAYKEKQLDELEGDFHKKLEQFAKAVKTTLRTAPRDVANECFDLAIDFLSQALPNVTGLETSATFERNEEKTSKLLEDNFEKLSKRLSGVEQKSMKNVLTTLREEHSGEISKVQLKMQKKRQRALRKAK